MIGWIGKKEDELQSLTQGKVPSATTQGEVEKYGLEQGKGEKREKRLHVMDEEKERESFRHLPPPS